MYGPSNLVTREVLSQVTDSVISLRGPLVLSLYMGRYNRRRSKMGIRSRWSNIELGESVYILDGFLYVSLYFRFGFLR